VFNLTVTRTGLNLASNIVVNYAVTGGTATQNLRYVLADGALTFAAGQASLPIPVQIINDLDPEGNQTVIVKLSSSTATIGPIGTTTLTILDDEQAITFSSPAYAVTEGIPSIAIPILRSGPTPGGVTVGLPGRAQRLRDPRLRLQDREHHAHLRGRRPLGAV